MSHEQIEITTHDGACTAHVFRPDPDRALSVIIFYMDAGGLRPAAIRMAERLSAAGYVVLLPDPFYRFGPYGPFDPAELFRRDVRATLAPLMATTGNAKAAEDTAAFLSYLGSRPDVRNGRMGAVGFCMRGGMAIAAAGALPDHFAGVVSFHGGNLATDAADSPRRYAPTLRAELFIAAAEDDGSYPPDMAARLERALDAAQVDYQAQTYPAAHGWMVPDFRVLRSACRTGVGRDVGLFRSDASMRAASCSRVVTL